MFRMPVGVRVVEGLLNRCKTLDIFYKGGGVDCEGLATLLILGPIQHILKHKKLIYFLLFSFTLMSNIKLTTR